MGDEFDHPLQGGNSQQSEYHNMGGGANGNLLTEGFDDAGEEGAGQKLLHLL